MSSVHSISARSALVALLLAALLAMLGACKGLPPAGIPEAPLPGAPMVVFDIDGTLTPNVRSIDTARPDAGAAVRTYADHGYAVVYLSARRSMFQHGIPGWLHRNRFPEGRIHVPQNDSEHDDPAAFKQRILNEYIARGWRVVAAFGDSSTDFEAYSKAGIPLERVFALRRRGRSRCEPGQWTRCLADWSGHLPQVEDPPP